MRTLGVRFSTRARWALLLTGAFVTQAAAQFETATVSGRVVDPSGASVVGARIRLVDSDRETTNSTSTNNSGIYAFPNVRPGRYRLEVDARGFKTVNVTGLTVNTQASLEQNFRLTVGSASESVTVEAYGTQLDLSGAVSAVVDQRFVKELPLNGRSFQTLFQLVPGVVVTPTNGLSQGQFSVNGQRTDTNYVTVDGASANAAASATGLPGQTASGSLPAFSASGGTNSLVSTESVQEFAIQTSSYAPEFGRTPGAQVSIVTRSGTNELHGDVFDYLRNDVVDANDWFANRDNIKRQALRQNDFGGVFGGPIYRDKTFFFLSYEGLRLRLPSTGQSDVPSLGSRNSSPASLQPYLDAFPVPTGVDEGNGLAPANYGFSNPSRLDAGSVRLDHHFSQSVAAFVRYNYAPSTVETRGPTGSALSTVAVASSDLQTLTLGLTYLVTPRLTDEARFNWSKSLVSSSFRADNFGGALPLTSEMMFPTPFTVRDSQFFFVPDESGLNAQLLAGRNVANSQRQINLIDNLSWQVGDHLLRFGVDYRRLTPHFGPISYLQQVEFIDVPTAIATSTPDFANLTAEVPVDSTYANYSLYAQDTWRANSRLTLTYGLRWDYNPVPSIRGSNGFRPLTVQSVTDLPAISLAPPGSSIYHATANNVAPRLGFAYQLRNSSLWTSVIRAGFGVFYDLGNAATGNIATGSPFRADAAVPNTATFPFSPSVAAPPALTLNPPFSDLIFAYPTTLKQPYTYQWNFSFEQSLGIGQTMTVGYVGSAAHGLFRTDKFIGGGLPADFTEVDFVNNLGYSHYSALQAQFRRRATKGLAILTTYTWSHSLDNGSSDAISGGPPGQFVNPNLDYASSDFDIRHTGSLALDYEFPRAGGPPIAKAVLNGWALDPVVTLRSSPNVNVFVIRNIGFGFYDFRPDLVPGVPLYVDDPSAPGGRRINALALSVPTQAVQGDLGRNFFRGFQLVQADLAIRRTFHITERLQLQGRVEAFNLFNHPNFSPNSGFLGTVVSGHLFQQSAFGVSQNMLNNGLSGSAIGVGFSPLYQIGGPRSLQFAVKLAF